jgi:hypothetical protein
MYFVANAANSRNWYKREKHHAALANGAKQSLFVVTPGGLPRVVMAVCLLLQRKITMRALLTAIAITVSLAGTSAYAQTESALDKALGDVPVEKMLSQILSAIDVNAITAGAEQAAKDLAAGKTPAPGNSQALQDMQTKLQNNMASMGPEVLRAMLGALGPMLTEIKNELKADLPGIASSR